MRFPALILTILWSSIVLGQPYDIKDQIPPTSIINVLNAKQSKLNTGDFSDKLLILDFMSVGCHSCVKALMRFDSLQNQYPNQLNFVLITPDKRDRISSFLSNNKIGQQLKLPIVASGHELDYYFPHQSISHIVWIYKGIVAAITNAEYVNKTNINKLISTGSISLPIKKDKPDYNYEITLLSQISTSAGQFPKLYSLLLSNKSGVRRKFKEGVDSSNGVKWIRMINFPIIDLYCKAYNLPYRLSPEQLILNVKDSATLRYDNKYEYLSKWIADNSFCYEISTPIDWNVKQIQAKMIADFNSYFNLSTSVSVNEYGNPVLEIKNSNQ